MGRKQKTIVAAAFCFLMLWGSPVYAGDINDAEQTIIDYYNQTFVYDGKSYVATENVKAAVYQKLAEDGTDLTERQVQSAIRQASKNIKQGVQKGYLLEVKSQEDAEDEIEQELPSGGEKHTDGENMPEAGGSTDTGNNPDAGNYSDDENGTPQIAQESNTENGEFILPDMGIGGNEEFISEAEQEKKIDLQDLIQEALQEGGDYSRVQASQQSKAVTVEQYLKGKVTAVSGNGDVLFVGSLPLKNTGYDTENNRLLAAMAIAGLVFLYACLSGASYIRKRWYADGQKR